MSVMWSGSWGYTCGTCGCYIPGDQGHTCRISFIPTGTAAVHSHAWSIARIETEAVGYPGLWTQVAYLLCQCGAVKRVVSE